MISRKYISDLFTYQQDGKLIKGGDNINRLYDYVIDSEINGAYLQVKEIVNLMSQPQHNDFIEYLNHQGIKIKRCFLKGVRFNKIARLRRRNTAF